MREKSFRDVQMTERRLVLMPHGLPAHEESRERCCQLLLCCGGDLSRIFDGSDREIARFAEYIASISDLVNAREIPLVVLTRVEPVAEKVLKARQVLQAEIAVLERAIWVVYADPFESETCLEALKRVGKFDRPALDAPLWTGPDDLRYLIVSPLMHSDVVLTLPERIHQASLCRRIQSIRPPQPDLWAAPRTRKVPSPAPQPHSPGRPRKPY
jgi:hypothetical protein